MSAHPCEPGCTCGLHPVGSVPNDVFRERAEAMMKAGTPVRELARAAGFVRSYTKQLKHGPKVYETPDTSMFLRLLGIKPTTSRKGYNTTRRTIPRDRAQALCHALEISYQEAGI